LKPPQWIRLKVHISLFNMLSNFRDIPFVRFSFTRY
jgi:hypothetical protein